MSIIEAIILGIVQGVTEFLPVSSSGHLVITNHILNTKGDFAFDVMLNYGTLLALVIYYRQRIWDIIWRAFGGKNWPLIGKLILATIPGVIVGLFFEDFITKLNDMLWVVIVMLLVVGVLMIIWGKPDPEADDRPVEQAIDTRRAGLVGLMQAVALIPGTSRSGVTILTGMKTGLSAARAAEFSFLLAIPIILGASLKTTVSSGGRDFLADNLDIVLIGNLASFISGILAVSFLIKLLSRRGLSDFGWYRVALALVLTVLSFVNII
jgi:undecaprenyl-diphosphatase